MDKLVTVNDVQAPKESPTPDDAQWKRVTIQLTPEQTAELAAAGVKTSAISIVTYDISRLVADVPN